MLFLFVVVVVVVVVVIVIVVFTVVVVNVVAVPILQSLVCPEQRPCHSWDSWYSERTLERLNYFKLLHCSPFQLPN